MLETFINEKRIGGINGLIWLDGEVLMQESFGYKNLETQEPLTMDSIFRISSMTKPITSVLALMLYEAGKLDLNDPITNWFEQFKEMQVLGSRTSALEKAKREITILDLLTHRAGFTYSEFQQGELRESYRALGGDIDSTLTNKEWVTKLAKLPLLNQPGELFNYGRSTDLLGILIATIEEKPLGRVMKEKIFDPLGMTDTFFEVPESKKNRCVSNFGFNDIGELVTLETVPLKMAFKERPAGLEYQSGGQGLWSTISDYLKFAQIFVEGGSSNGIRILKPETIENMCTNKLTASQREHSRLMGNPMFQQDYGFGLGLAVVCQEDISGSIPCSGSVGSVGWPGAYGGWWSADPENKTISIFLTHSMTEPGQLEQGIGFELYEAIEVFSNYV
ncbi:MAG: beta-lactamase family protein [Bacteroidetes bacterium]|nr:beta-lactamase family protein [Bacteroidota bacterium]